LRVIDHPSGERCARNEHELRWNAQGPQGEPGVQGEPGDAGALGDGSVDTRHLAEGAVTNQKLFGGIALDKLAEKVVTEEGFSAFRTDLLSDDGGEPLVHGQRITGPIDGSLLLDGTVTARHLSRADSSGGAAVTRDAIEEGAVDASKLAVALQAYLHAMRADLDALEPRVDALATPRSGASPDLVHSTRLAGVGVHTVVQDPSAVPAGEYARSTFAIPGVSPGDLLTVAPQSGLDLEFVNGYVSGPGSVTVVVHNSSSSPSSAYPWEWTFTVMDVTP
jgi:hypothetical protein